MNNLAKTRKRFRRGNSSPEKFSTESEFVFRIEDAFIGKLRQVLVTNLDDDEFCITQLCRELAVSHTQLYRKFKSASNSTIAEYFKNLRMQKAKSLLSTTKLNVTEVAFAAGFKNLSYFSREFTHHFGKNPKKFRTLTSRKLLMDKNEIGTHSKTLQVVLP